MAQYIDKSALIVEMERIRRIEVTNNDVAYNGALDEIKYFLDTLEVKEIDFWHKQSEEDIYDSIIGWSMHSFICLMKDGTTQKFTGIQDESYEGSISKHLDCVDDNYEWEYDDIIYWIEVPNIKAQKGE